MKNPLTWFIASVILTAIFSYSLNVFLQEDFLPLTLKTMLIPCFTWSVLLLSAWRQLAPPQRSDYFLVAGKVCAAGSLALVPVGIYNYTAADPKLFFSVFSILFCVLLMSGLFYVMLEKNNLPRKWWWAFNVLICVNMALFYLSTQL